MPPAPAEPPPELAAALEASPAARTAYGAMPPSHRREYDAWVAEAKRPETRTRRAAETVDLLLSPRRP